MTIINPTMQVKNKHGFNQKRYFRSKERFETLPEDVIEKIEIALAQADAGLTIPAEQFYKEMEEKYGFHS